MIGSPARRRDHAAPWLFAGAALSIAYAVKRFYSSASVDALQWLLAPVAATGGWVTGRPFDLEPGVGYVNTTLLFAIVPACAGLNFGIVAFLSIAWIWLRRIDSLAAAAARLAVATILAYVVTLTANTVRIVLAIGLHAYDVRWGPLTPKVLRRAVGVGIYVTTLLLVVEGLRAGVSVAVPLAIYGAVSLGVPLLNHAAVQGEFVAHAMATVAVSSAVAVGWAAARRGFGVSRSRRPVLRLP